MMSGRLCIQVLFLVTEQQSLATTPLLCKSFFWFLFTLPFHLLNPNLLHNLLCVDIWYAWRVTAWQLNVWICTFSRSNARMLVSLIKPTEWMCAASIDPVKNIRWNEWDLICLSKLVLICLMKWGWFFQDQRRLTLGIYQEPTCLKEKLCKKN